MGRITACAMAFLLVLTAVAGCTHSTGKTAGRSSDDTVIAGDIKAKILRDPELRTWAVDVDVYQGNVTLAGQVPDKAAEQRLIGMAQSTKGVRSVTSNLQVAATAKTEKPASAR